MHLGFISHRTGNIRRVKIMIKSARVLVATVGLIIVIEVPNSFAQFGGRGGLGGIFGGTSRGSRGNTQNNGNSVTRPIPDSYEQTEHRLALMEADLHLTPQQREPWQTFTNKVRAYASDLSREHARTGIPASEGPISGLQHIDLITDGARIRLNELEDIRTAANALYATLSLDQKKIADTRMVTLITPPSGLTGGDGSRSLSGLGSTTR
jgi:LTXXQ motif family protein